MISVVYIYADKSQDGSVIGVYTGERRSVYRGTETKSLVKCILFLGHTSRSVSYSPRMSPAISSVCWIKREKETRRMYVSS